MQLRVLVLASLFFTYATAAQEPVKPSVFDIHVHLRDGGKSLRAYSAEVESASGQVEGLGAMWFGGPHQAPAGKPEDIRVRNDALIALAQENPRVVPIATVHPYDGQAALDETPNKTPNKTPNATEVCCKNIVCLFDSFKSKPAVARRWNRAEEKVKNPNSGRAYPVRLRIFRGGD